MRQRGFAVPEILLAATLMIAIAFATLIVLQSFVKAVAARSTSEGGSIAVNQELDRMRADAATAYAIFVPSKDVMGDPNAAGADTGTPASGHEVDFYGRTDTGAEAYWAYRYDGAAGTLQRYDYVVNAGGSPSQIGMIDRSTGRFDPAGHYPVITGVTGFDARTLHADQLASAPNELAPLISELVRQAGTAPHADPVGFIPANGRPRGDLYGGNTTVRLQVTTAHGSASAHLTSAEMPSGFTVHEYPSMRGYVYRIDQVHRFWFGLAQITHFDIYEQLQYSYTPTDTQSWKVWCDFKIVQKQRLGANSANYQPLSWQESMAGVYDYVAGNHFSDKDPTSNCNTAVPRPNASNVPSPAPAPSDLGPTPPPCFAQGQCWPDQAPPDWNPPSPWPAAPPPPAWCADHALSPLCGYAGSPQPTPSAGMNSPPPITYETSAPTTPPRGLATIAPTATPPPQRGHF